MKKKIYLLVFAAVCILACGTLLTACNNKPSIAFTEGATLSREYNGSAISQNEVLEIVESETEEELTIVFYQGETPVENPTDAGTYKVVVSSSKDSIEDTFTISPKALKNVVFTGTWTNGTGERTWTKAPLLLASAGLISGDQVTATVKTASYDMNADISSIELTGEDASNYSLSEEDVSILVALKLTITSSADPEQTLDIFVRYGDNNVYANGLGTALLTETKLEDFGTITKIYNANDSSKTEFISLETDSFGKLLPNAKYSQDNMLTDAFGRWIITNGSVAETINFIAEIAE